jgi:AAA domain
MGKSWMAFGLAIAVASGGVALGVKRVEQGDALYLSLEDSERRLHRRINKLASDAADLSRLHCVTEWKPADRGGLEDLDAWLEDHPDTRLVVIDTLKRIRPHTSGRRNMYDDDYDAVQPFVPLADKHDVALVLIHHLNQQSNPDDPFDWFSGSAGLVAAAEGILLFRRKRGDADAYLTIDGKDIEERAELAVKWDPLAATWTVIGDAEAHRLSETRLAILRVVEDADGPLGPTDVADALGQPVNTIKQRMHQMSKDGELRVESRGRYVIGSHNLHNLHNQEDQKVMKVMEVMEEDVRLDTNGFLSADEGNARVQELIDQGMRPDLAAAEVIKRMKEDG